MLVVLLLVQFIWLGLGSRSFSPASAMRQRCARQVRWRQWLFPQTSKARTTPRDALLDQTIPSSPRVQLSTEHGAPIQEPHCKSKTHVVDGIFPVTLDYSFLVCV